MERLLLGLYSLLMWAAQPLLWRKLSRRGKAEPGYRVARGERFGRYAGAAPKGALWLHAVSLGETRAAAVLLAELRQREPGLRVLLTHGTATGREEGARLLRDGDRQAWLPWDTPGAVARFLDHFAPRMGVLIETEIWPNLCAACRARGIPLVLANARLSERSQQKALQLGALLQPAYESLAAAYAQSEDDAARLRSLGAPVAGVFGNLKFDARPAAPLLALGRMWRDAVARPVVMLASAREGEETAFLAAIEEKMATQRAGTHSSAIKSGAAGGDPGVQWLIVPRHPQRFDAVVALAQARGWTVSRRSAWGDGPPLEAQVWIGDSLGEMALYYALADAALLGGSFEPLGGQNLIEAAACGCPVLMGPHTFNFADAAQGALEAGAAVRSEGMAAAVDEALALAADRARRDAMSKAGEAIAAQHRGAAARTAEAVLATRAGA